MPGWVGCGTIRAMARRTAKKRPPKYEQVKRIALALPDVREEGHRHGPWFNVGKRVFALYWGRSESWMIRTRRVPGPAQNRRSSQPTRIS